jgi:hypothetical protein
MAQEEELTSTGLTVRAQTIPLNDTGRLLWDAFFPRRNVDSVKISEISDLDFRPVSDRREWNARGRYIPLVTPKTAEMEMVPVESFFSIAEREVQELEERTFGNEEAFRNQIRVKIPARTDVLVESLYRRLEMDAFRVWALNEIAVMNPLTGVVTTVDMGVDAARHQTALTAWNDPGLNAYEEFIAWLEDGIDAVGAIQGVMIRLATLKEIQADAPQGFNAITLTRAQLVDRIQQDLGTGFQFFVNEQSLDMFTDGTTTPTRTKVWAAEKIAAIPVGEVVGEMAFAPVARAIDIARGAPGAGIDVRGATVYTETMNGGRGATIEAQVNAMPVPNEPKIWVIDAGV